MKMNYIDKNYRIIPMIVGFDIRWFIIGEGFGLFSESFTTREEAISSIIDYLDNICFWKHLDNYKSNKVFPMYHNIKDGIGKYGRFEDELNNRPYCEFCGKRIVIDD